MYSDLGTKLEVMKECGRKQSGIVIHQSGCPIAPELQTWKARPKYKKSPRKQWESHRLRKTCFSHRNVAKDMDTEAPPSWNSSCHCQSSDLATVQNALLGFMPTSWSTDWRVANFVRSCALVVVCTSILFHASVSVVVLFQRHDSDPTNRNKSRRFFFLEFHTWVYFIYIISIHLFHSFSSSYGPVYTFLIFYYYCMHSIPWCNIARVWKSKDSCVESALFTSVCTPPIELKYWATQQAPLSAEPPC